MSEPRTPLVSAVSQFRACWRQLALADIASTVGAFVLLTPLVTLVFRILLAMSGRTVLADQDILLFLLHPVGWLTGILVGGLLLAIVALEQSALLAVLYANQASRRIDAVAALRFALAHAWPVLRVAARTVGATLLAIAPFLAVLGLTYFALLGGHDINYCLKERPPAFLTALVVGGVVMAALAAVLLRLFTGWFYALPLVLFEDVSPARALAASRGRARGHRAALLGWVVGWGLGLAAVSAAATSITDKRALARAVVTQRAGMSPALRLLLELSGILGVTPEITGI